jgi:hypothetical protein
VTALSQIELNSTKLHEKNKILSNQAYTARVMALSYVELNRTGNSIPWFLIKS